jgi:hypothetical protein
MNDDGDIDYSNYTRRELEEALAGINKNKYPKNYANLSIAYERTTGSYPTDDGKIETETESADTTTRRPSAWDRFWFSRPVRGLLGLFCFWWAHDQYANTECSPGGKLIGFLVRTVCTRFGHHAAAAIPLALGLTLVFFVAFPKREVRA